MPTPNAITHAWYTKRIWQASKHDSFCDNNANLSETLALVNKNDGALQHSQFSDSQAIIQEKVNKIAAASTHHAQALQRIQHVGYKCLNQRD